ITYVPCASGTDTPTTVPSVTGTPPTTTPTRTPTRTSTPSPTACGFPLAWDNEVPMPTTRDYPGGAVVNGLLYVIGGYRGIYGDTGSVERYDPDAGTWTTLAPVPTPVGE